MSRRDATDWYNKEIDLHRSGDYEKTIQCYDRTLEIDPGFSIAQSLKDLAYLHLMSNGRRL